MKIFLFFSLLFFSIVSEASRLLVGHWKVDVVKTNEFNQKNIKMSDLEAALLSCISVHTEMIFKKDEFAHNIDDAMCSYGKKEEKVKGSFSHGKYRVVYKGEGSSVVLLMYSDKGRVVLLHWLDDSNFWVNNDPYPTRTYYKKVEGRK